MRLTPVAGVAYDGAGAESRLIMGDYTSGIFGNNLDMTIDYVRYGQTAAYLPTGADADNDGLPDFWEFAFYHTGGTYAQMVAALTSAVASADDDGDGMTNLQECIANTSPINPASALKIDCANSLRPRLKSP